MVPCAADELPSVQVSSPEGGGANVKNKARNCVLSRTSTTRRGFHPRKSNATKDYICELCSKSFHKRWHLIHHLRMHTGEKPHRCGTCDKAFTQKGDLTRHLRIHTGDKPYKCDDCNKAFTHKSNLVQHSRRHTGEKPFQCHDCSKSFSRKSVLIQHVLLHSGHKPYTCDQCHKLFSRKGALIKHKWSHTGKWPYQCDQCNKGFSDRTHMDSHMRSHNGEKPYECDECGKTFADKSNLCRHIKMHSRDYNRRCQQCGTPLLTRRNSHTPQKPNTCRKCLESFLIKTRSKTDVMFKCDICEKEFTLKSNLAQHLILHTNVKPYSCQVCGKEFSHRSNLARHRNIHTQAGTHKCSFCDKVFSRIITFNQHMKSHEKSGLKGELRICVDSGTNSVGEEAGSRNMNVCVESASQAGDPNPTAEATNGTAADENGMSTNSEESDTKENIATVQQTPHDPGVQSRLPMVTIPRENIVEIKTEREGDERYGCITQQERNVYNAQSTITVNCNTVLTSGATHHVSDPTQEGKNTKRNASATTNGLQCQRGHGDIPMVTIPAMNILEFKKEKDNDSCAINQTGQSMSVLCGESVTTQEHSAATSCSSSSAAPQQCCAVSNTAATQHQLSHQRNTERNKQSTVTFPRGNTLQLKVERPNIDEPSHDMQQYGSVITSTRTAAPSSNTAHSMLSSNTTHMLTSNTIHSMLTSSTAHSMLTSNISESMYLLSQQQRIKESQHRHFSQHPSRRENQPLSLISTINTQQPHREAESFPEGPLHPPITTNTLALNPSVNYEHDYASAFAIAMQKIVQSTYSINAYVAYANLLQEMSSLGRDVSEEVDVLQRGGALASYRQSVLSHSLARYDAWLRLRAQVEAQRNADVKMALDVDAKEHFNLRTY